MTLEVERLSVSLGGVPVLNAVSFAIGAGETVGLVGESGSGKSMLALALIRLLPPHALISGYIRLQGTPIGPDEAAFRAVRGMKIGMVFQEPLAALDPLQRVDRAVAEPLRLRGMGRREASLRAKALLARVGVVADYPHRLSGGQRQRALIAAALAGDPVLLLADEPTTALDATTQTQILDLLAELARERDLAMILISHDLAVVADRAARVLVLYAGHLLEAGPTAAVLARPAHPYTRALLAASPHLAGAPVPIPGRLPDPRAMPPGCPFAPRCPRVSARCETMPELEGGERLVACHHPW